MRLAILRLLMPWSKTAELLYRTEADAVGLPQSTVDGAGFRNAHFGAADEWGNVRRIGIAKPHETTRATRLANGALKDPAARNGIAETLQLLNAHFDASFALCEPQQAGMRYVPMTIEEPNIAESNRDSVLPG